MSRFFAIFFLALIACAMAFTPSRFGRVSSRVAAPKTIVNMTPADVVIDTTNVLSQFSQTLAAEGDFGGYAGPAGSLLLIGFLILSLAPPLAEKN